MVCDGDRCPMVTLTLRFVLDRYVACLTGRSHVDLPDEEKRRMKLEKGENIDPNKYIESRNFATKRNTIHDQVPVKHFMSQT